MVHAASTYCRLLILLYPIFYVSNDDGSPLAISLESTSSASSPLLRTLVSIFESRQSLSYLDPPVPIILLSIADHLSDSNTEKFSSSMTQQHLLNPTSPSWLENWSLLLGTRCLYQTTRPSTRRAVMFAMESVFTLIKDMPTYRSRFMGLVFDFWMRLVEERNDGCDDLNVWHMLGDEIVLRALEDQTEELFTPVNETPPEASDASTEKIMMSMISVSGHCDCDRELHTTVSSSEGGPSTSPPAPMTPSNTVASGSISPNLSRTVTDVQPVQKERESGNNIQQIMSLLSFGGSRHQSQAQVPQVLMEEPTPTIPARVEPIAPPTLSPVSFTVSCRGHLAVTALIDILLQLAFVDSVMTKRQARLTVYVFQKLLKLLRTAICPRARVAILQALMRLRADRDHRVYIEANLAEPDKHIITLANQIGRTRGCSGSQSQSDEPRVDDMLEKAWSANVFDRNGRRSSRGRASRNSATVSRSRSRATGPQAGANFNVKPRDRLWIIPDIVPFSLDNSGKSSQLVIAYNTLSLDQAAELVVSDYLDVLVEVLKTERDWEVLSYLLVHLPTQLANKHFWCGPNAKKSLANLITELCKSILEGTLGKYTSQDDWPGSSKSRDAQALAYHTLTVLISYHTIIPPDTKQKMVEVFQGGLSGRGDSVVVCTHALALCAFEMEPIVVKLLPRILEKLSQIMSNPAMAVHILTFLAILPSLPHLYASFTENDFKTVFAIALQYLQHHNRMEVVAELQFSLSEHVRIMSYYVIYIWFLAVKLPDRPRHVPFIARQLLLANEGQERVDDATEVCFDFIARYAYANADPRPAPSLLGEILSEGSSEVLQEKSWILGHSIITIRLLAKPGWVEVIARRPSGTTKFLCKSENVPLVSLGDTNPDMTTIPAALMMEKDIRAAFGFMSPETLSPPPELPPSLVNGTVHYTFVYSLIYALRPVLMNNYPRYSDQTSLIRSLNLIL